MFCFNETDTTMLEKFIQEKNTLKITKIKLVFKGGVKL